MWVFKRAISKQSACLGSGLMLNAMSATMVVRCTEHLRILDSLSAIFTDICAPALENDVCDDIKQVARKFGGRICWI